jgi:hypothetical protein
MMKNDDQILDGFNDGYTIQKYEPELANQMIANLDGVDEPYMKGFVAGAKEYQMEKELDKSNLFPGMDEDFHQGFGDKDRDKDREEPDIDMDI